jgi:hypothetical protein
MGKIASIFGTYPLTTVRTRIQQDQFNINEKIPKYISIIDIVSRMVKDEGIYGFYKGMWANLLKGIPQRGLYFYCY